MFQLYSYSMEIKHYFRLKGFIIFFFNMSRYYVEYIFQITRIKMKKKLCFIDFVIRGPKHMLP